ncbi:hypothetical protein Pmani_033264 [Petrolisthes manimaculis]|uniref:Uncharacterized protein n=1 Tax=Petrolisthes manimaculis TaxID=1843537 RepID=A0AAE1NQT8_9EUCA|nr:hypothetical protein Pmani_033264 [Petrolisthes manimaculis]
MIHRSLLVYTVLLFILFLAFSPVSVKGRHATSVVGGDSGESRESLVSMGNMYGGIEPPCRRFECYSDGPDNTCVEDEPCLLGTRGGFPSRP